MPVDLDQAWNIISRYCITHLDNINHRLEDSQGAYLCDDLRAKCHHPHIDIAAMDGYCFRAQDSGNPLELVGTIAAGDNSQNLTIKSGQCVRILTGAMIPKGLDCVAMQEDCSVLGTKINVPFSKAGQFIRYQGCDFIKGTPLIEQGTRLNSRHIALGLSAGHQYVAIKQAPRVEILASGSELINPDFNDQNSGENSRGTINSNAPSLAAFCTQAGANVTRVSQCPDDLNSLCQAISRADQNHLIITTGGVSVGDKDLIKPALQHLGAEILFHGILVKPGKPTLFAQYKNTLILGLPGNPVSAQICAELFALPILRLLQNARTPFPTAQPACLDEALPSGKARLNFVRGLRYIAPNGQQRVRLMGNQDSAALHSLSKANCLVSIAVDSPALKAGSIVPTYWLH